MKYFLLLTLAISFTLAGRQDFSLAKRYFKDEVYGKVIEHYQKYLEEAPKGDSKIPAAKLGIAQAYEKLKEWGQAEYTYQNFISTHSTNPNVPDALLARANVLGYLGRHAQAAEMYFSYYSLKQGDWLEKALFKSAFHSWKAQKRDDAKIKVQQYIRRYSKGKNLGKVYLLQGKIAMQAGAMAEAAEAFEQALPLIKDSLRKMVLWDWSISLAGSAQYVRAQKSYAMVLANANSADSLKISEEYTALLAKAGQDSLLVEYLKSRPLKSLSELLRLRYAKAELARQKYSEVKSILQGYSFTDLSYKKQGQFILAETFLSLGERAEGIELLKSLSDQGVHSVWHKMAEVYVEDGLYLKAIRSWTQGIEALPDSLAYYLAIADLYENKLKRYETARDVYAAFLQKYPDEGLASKAAWGVAQSLEKESSFGKAFKAYKNLTEDYPSSIEAKMALERSQYLANYKIINTDDALSHILKMMEGDGQNQNLLLARIYAEDLKDFEKARELLIKHIENATSSEQKALGLYQKGNMEKNLLEKAKFEQNIAAANRWEVEALKTYTQLSQKDSSRWADDGLYLVLTLKPFSFADYSKFVQENKTSNRLPDALLAMGHDYLNQAEDMGAKIGAKSLDYFQRILNEFPRSKFQSKALLGAAKAYKYRKAYASAQSLLRLFQQAKSSNEEKAMALLLAGELWSAAGKDTEAIREYKKILYKYRNSSSASVATFRMGESFVKVNDFAKAKKSWSDYTDFYGQGEFLFASYQKIAQIFAKNGDWKGATELYLAYLAKYPNHADVYFAYEKLAYLYVRRNDKIRAVRFFEKSLPKLSPPKKREAHLMMGDLYLQLDQFDSAKIVFDLAYAGSVNAKDSAKALGGRLASLAMLGKKKQFQKGYKIFRSEFEDNLEIHARIIYYDGRNLMEKKQERRARKRFQYLADKFEETSWAAEGNFYLGTLSFKKSEFDTAGRLLQSYLKQSPDGRNSQDARFKLAGCQYQLKKYAASAKSYETVLASDKGEDLTKYRASYNAALAWEKAGNWIGAAKNYQRIYELYAEYQNPTSVLVSAGFAWFNGSNFSKAKESFVKALKDSTSDRRAEAHYWYAKTLDRLEQVDEALSEFLKVSYLYNGEGMWGLTALFEVGQIYQRSGDKLRAAKMYRKIVEQDGKSGTLGRRASKYLELLEGTGG